MSLKWDAGDSLPMWCMAAFETTDRSHSRWTEKAEGCYRQSEISRTARFHCPQRDTSTISYRSGTKSLPPSAAFQHGFDIFPGVDIRKLLCLQAAVTPFTLTISCRRDFCKTYDAVFPEDLPCRPKRTDYTGLFPPKHES